jgi:hypothetical protein
VNFTAQVYRVLLSAGKSLSKIMETLCAEAVWIIRVNIIVIAIIFSEKMEALLSYHPSYVKICLKLFHVFHNEQQQ